ncbi:manganese-dependent inorganic pyrophosphatase [Roseinatronobacter thiooxidans]|uniref:inorganic diphosphatase n=1 Tax=Roseinatronobacter thiooxidans TaxID=121821 RepID=A0A2W7Q0F6_9RHOB|nr:manganese-dependent inorganic pyrophosphatase [Roseinatronobacter thiooxidans]PZX41998.1 manganese-dependent inorganic pyrophosphatase [Roseinatronobacter thiooxidans]
MIKVFGHYSPDTDSTGSPLIWAWYLTQIKNTPAEAVLLGQPNTEAKFALEHWGFEQPEILQDLGAGTPVVIVDTNNPDELPKNINDADIQGIIDHHKLVGGLETKGPIDITIRPLACTATLMYELIGKHMAQAPRGVKGMMLSCILSDTLEFRSPTTTQTDRAVAHALAEELGVDIGDLATQMFAAKSDVSAFSDAELLKMDAKKYKVGDKTFRISVLETTAPDQILSRKDALVAAMPAVAAEDGADEVMLFVIDILNEEATLLVPNDLVRTVAEKSFNVTVAGDSIVLPGVMSRKKQIIPVLTQ